MLIAKEAVFREVPAVSSCAVSKELLVRGRKAFRLTRSCALKLVCSQLQLRKQGLAPQFTKQWGLDTGNHVNCKG
eukprot:s408_g17.t1